MKQPPPATSKGVPSAADQSWITHAQKEKQEAPKRLEEVAKFLVGIISISLTVFITKQPEGLGQSAKELLSGATIYWFVSIGLCFFVLFPWRYRFNPDSPTDIQRAFKLITDWKYFLLVFSVVAYLIALGMVGYVFWSGLQGVGR